MSEQWFVFRNGVQEERLHTTEEVRALPEYPDGVFVWREGMAEWSAPVSLPAFSVAPMAPLLPPSPRSSPTPRVPAQPTAAYQPMDPDAIYREDNAELNSLGKGILWGLLGLIPVAGAFVLVYKLAGKVWQEKSPWLPTLLLLVPLANIAVPLYLLLLVFRRIGGKFLCGLLLAAVIPILLIVALLLALLVFGAIGSVGIVPSQVEPVPEMGFATPSEPQTMGQGTAVLSTVTYDVAPPMPVPESVSDPAQAQDADLSRIDFTVQGEAETFRWTDEDWILRFDLEIRNSSDREVSLPLARFQVAGDDTPMSRWTPAGTLTDPVQIPAGGSVRGYGAWYYSRSNPAPERGVISMENGARAEVAVRQIERPALN